MPEKEQREREFGSNRARQPIWQCLGQARAAHLLAAGQRCCARPIDVSWRLYVGAAIRPAKSHDRCSRRSARGNRDASFLKGGHLIHMRPGGHVSLLDQRSAAVKPSPMFLTQEISCLKMRLTPLQHLYI